ncbi:unnamed protein product, partial [Discosporangium mesarthrocarpum]
MSTMQSTIEARLTEALSPTYLEVINESHMHSGPAQESHFKVVVVSEEFEGKSLLARHRLVNELFSEEMKGAVHALSIQSKTPSQWEAEGHKVAPSPPCMGGSKADPQMLSETTQQPAPIPATVSASHHARQKIFKRHTFSAAGLAASWSLCCLGVIGVMILLSTPLTAVAAEVRAGCAPGVVGMGASPRAGRTRAFCSAVLAAAATSSSPTPPTLVENMDHAFALFSTVVAQVLGKPSGTRVERALGQTLGLGDLAWLTASAATIPAGCLAGAPLGQAMVATVSSHCAFTLVKFFLGTSALGTYRPTPPGRAPPVAGSPQPEPKVSDKKSIRSDTNEEGSQTSAGTRTGASSGGEEGRGGGATTDRPSPSPPGGAVELKRKGKGKQSVLLPPWRQKERPRHRGGRDRSARGQGQWQGQGQGQGQGKVLMRAVRKRGSVPPLWLSAVTATGGPAVGTMVALVASRGGRLSFLAANSALWRGSIAATLVSGGLCQTGLGVGVAARWTFLQAAVGSILMPSLSPTTFMFVYFLRFSLSSNGRGSGRG